MIDNSSIVEESTLLEQQERQRPKTQGDTLESSVGLQGERAPYATRVRVVILLSLVCWAIIAAVVAWLVY